VQNPVKTGATILFLGVSLVFLILATHQHLLEQAELDKKAQAAGFADGSEMEQATASGFSDPAKWKAELSRRVEATRAAEAKAEAAAAARKAEKDESNRRFQAAVQGAIALREAMKNPDSFSLETVIRHADGSLCYTYRAANSFNAIIPGSAVITPTAGAASGDPAFAKLWNQHCKGYGEEIANVGYALTNFYPRRKN
jgi:hypothetical protein